MGNPTHITDHTGSMLDRLLEQYKGKPNFEKVVTISGERWQVLEDLAWDAHSFVLRNIDSATDELLNIFGRIVGEPRGNATSEAEYRFRVRARVAANRSKGMPEHIYSVFRALVGPDSTAVTEYVFSGDASFIFDLRDYSLAEQFVPVFQGFMRDAKAGGVRAILASYEGDEDEAMRFGVCAFLSAAHLAGVTTLNVYSTAGLPTAGELVIDEGTAAEEVVTYTGKTSNTLTGVSATANAHGERACCSWTDSPGLGLGDHADPSVGGYAGRWTGVEA